MSILKVNTIQDKGGNNLVTSDGSGVITSSAFGKIGQVKSVLLSTQTFTNSTSLAETEATLSITPSSTSSKILIQWDTPFRRNNTNTGTYVNFSLYKNGSLLQPIEKGFSNTMSVKLWCRATYQLLDSPSTTSATTYAVYWARAGASESGGFYLCDGGASNATGSFTLMEVLP